MDYRIGIIGDGPTDLRVIGKLAECIVSYRRIDPKPPRIFELGRLNIRDPVDKYWAQASREDEYHLSGEAGMRLQQEVVALLLKAIDEFKTLASCDNLSYKDMILLSTDSERRLKSIDAYFDNYAFHLAKILMAAIEKLYHQMVQWGFERQFIPTIVPLPLFPSTEIIVAAARNSGLSIHDRTPDELKRMLYNVHDMDQLLPEDLDRHPLAHITTDSLDRIFSFVPEVRYLIHIMLWRA